MIGNLGPWAVILTLFFTHVRIITPDKRFRNNQPLSPGYPVGASGLDGYYLQYVLLPL
jgi:hypothetical protein